MIVHPSANAALLDSADATWQYLSNGDDAFALMFSATASFGNEGDWDLLDVIGEPYGLDPGSAWDVAGTTNGTQDHTLRRKSNISFGNGGDWTTSAGTSAEDSEWIVLGNDYALNNALEGYNSHDFTGLCATSSEGCTDPLALNFDPNGDGGRWQLPVHPERHHPRNQPRLDHRHRHNHWYRDGRVLDR